MLEAIENRSAAVVVLGAFSPAMFHPLWFKHYGLIGDQEAEVASDPKATLVSNDVSLFKVAGFEFDIRQDRLQIGTAQEHLLQPLRDLVASTMSILDAAPITAVGLNWAYHFATGDEAAWHAAGHRMIPYSFWRKQWPKHIGMLNVTLQLDRDDDMKGSIQVKLEPSRVVTRGVYFSVNDHHELATGKPLQTPASTAGKVVEEQWARSQARAAALVEGVRKEALGA